MRIEGTGPNRPVSDEQVELWRAERLANLPDDVPSSIPEAIKTAAYNETFPAFSGVLLDADGRIWIAEAPDYGAEVRRWTVFGPDGDPRFRVRLPAGATLLDADGDRVLILDRNELAEEMVRGLVLEPVR